ncbi:O-antigen ligase family protein [Nesterenkonia ebinurensis]|uniref:O-antigen ligase family protein n=1 Tax=Nesterenkonia ebinurensis TaxID=2608252 RepID=UPI00168AA4AC|nr:O-antigen ligase family protein [Nesterenkonia ebinurensis]
MLSAVVQHPWVYNANTGRAFGTFIHPNGAALFSAVFATLALFLVLTLKQRRYVLALLLGIAGLAVTASMGGFATFAIAALVLVFAGEWPGRLKFAASGLAVLGGVVILSTERFRERVAELESTLSFHEAAAGHITNSVDWRFYNWTLFSRAWGEDPFFGRGLGMTQENLQPLGQQVHNEYLRTMVETGVIGGLIALVILLIYLNRTFAVCRRAEYRGAALSLSLVIAVLINAVAANTLTYMPAMLLTIGLAPLSSIPWDGHYEEPSQHKKGTS